LIKDLKLFCTCPLNTEELLVNELVDLGAENCKISPSGVAFNGNLEIVYKACLCSRIAGKLFLELVEFDLNDQHDIYKFAKEIPWDEHFSVDDTFATSAAVVKSRVKNSKYASLLVKDAIADYFTDKYERRPNVDPKKPSVKVHLHISKNKASISLDLSGESLHKRGYRDGNAHAALKENVAAALLYRGNWPKMSKEGLNFLDPMCGSGTLLIEAAYIATNTPPGYYRHYYGFLGWLKHDVDLWDEVFDDVEKSIRPYSGVIRGFDMDRDAISQSIHNISNAGFSKLIHVEKSELSEFEVVESMTYKSGLICINPPYGVRLGDVPELKKLYAEFSNLFLEKLPGWKLSVITGEDELSRVIPLKIDKKHTLFNGAIKCTVSHFTLEDNKKKVEAPLSQGGISFKNRLIKRSKHLGKWAKRSGVSCYRVYDADLPDYNVAIDIYENTWITVSEYQAPKEIELHVVKKRLDEVLRVVPEVLDVDSDNVYLKVRKRQKGSTQYYKNDTSKEFNIVHESGAKFYVNFKDYLDTGIFLDHRPIRRWIRDNVEGKSLLNLFSYTGTVTSLAAIGGAKSTTTVDASKTYIEWAKRNIQLNGLYSENHKFFVSDTKEWLKKDRNSYDVIFLDPPTFSNSKSGRDIFDVQVDYIELIQLCAKILKKSGVLIFSNNFRKFKFDETLFPDLEIKDISSSTIDQDFSNNPKIHRCWEIKWQTNH